MMGHNKLRRYVRDYQRAHADYCAAEIALDQAEDCLQVAIDQLADAGATDPLAWTAGDRVILLEPDGDGGYNLMTYPLAGSLDHDDSDDLIGGVRW